jgi:hypothetical protein
MSRSGALGATLRSKQQFWGSRLNPNCETSLFGPILLQQVLFMGLACDHDQEEGESLTRFNDTRSCR